MGQKCSGTQSSQRDSSSKLRQHQYVSRATYANVYAAAGPKHPPSPGGERLDDQYVFMPTPTNNATEKPSLMASPLGVVFISIFKALLKNGVMQSLKKTLRYGLIFLYWHILVPPVKLMMVFLFAIYEPLLKNGPTTLLKALDWTITKIGIFLLVYVIPALLDFIFLILASVMNLISEYGLPFLIGTFNTILSNEESGESDLSTGSKNIGKRTFSNKLSEEEVTGLTRFSENFEALLQNDHLSDFAITVKDTEIRIHRPILAARSPVFASILEVDETSGNARTLAINDCESDTFRDFLYYVYTGKTERIRRDNVIGLFELASKYAVPSLKEVCDRYMRDTISADTVCDVLAAGIRLSENGLVLSGTEFFLSNTREILRTVKWQKFLEEYTDAANELFKGSLTVPSCSNETANYVKETKKTSMKDTEHEHLINLSESIEALFLNDHFSDFTVKVSDREFKVHKAIVASQSEVFASMLQHEMKESITGILEVFDCDSHVFEDFLFYLYSAKTQKVSETNAVSLYQLAEKYNICKLKEECGRFMKENMSVACFCDVMALAIVHKDTDLIKVATNYFISYAKEIISSQKWRVFARENPTVANELYIKRVDSGTETS